MVDSLTVLLTLSKGKQAIKAFITALYEKDKQQFARNLVSCIDLLVELLYSYHDSSIYFIYHQEEATFSIKHNLSGAEQFAIELSTILKTLHSIMDTLHLLFKQQSAANQDLKLVIDHSQAMSQSCSILLACLVSFFETKDASVLIRILCILNKIPTLCLDQPSQIALLMSPTMAELLDHIRVECSTKLYPAFEHFFKKFSAFSIFTTANICTAYEIVDKWINHMAKTNFADDESLFTLVKLLGRIFSYLPPNQQSLDIKDAFLHTVLKLTSLQIKDIGKTYLLLYSLVNSNKVLLYTCKHACMIEICTNMLSTCTSAWHLQLEDQIPLKAAIQTIDVANFSISQSRRADMVDAILKIIHYGHQLASQLLQYLEHDRKDLGNPATKLQANVVDQIGKSLLVGLQYLTYTAHHNHQDPLLLFASILALVERVAVLASVELVPVMVYLFESNLPRQMEGKCLELAAFLLPRCISIPNLCFWLLQKLTDCKGGSLLQQNQSLTLDPLFSHPDWFAYLLANSPSRLCLPNLVTFFNNSNTDQHKFIHILVRNCQYTCEALAIISYIAESNDRPHINYPEILNVLSDILTRNRLIFVCKTCPYHRASLDKLRLDKSCKELALLVANLSNWAFQLALDKMQHRLWLKWLYVFASACANFLPFSDSIAQFASTVATKMIEDCWAGILLAELCVIRLRRQSDAALDCRNEPFTRWFENDLSTEWNQLFRSFCDSHSACNITTAYASYQILFGSDGSSYLDILSSAIFDCKFPKFYREQRLQLVAAVCCLLWDKSLEWWDRIETTIVLPHSPVIEYADSLENLDISDKLANLFPPSLQRLYTNPVNLPSATINWACSEPLNQLRLLEYLFSPNQVGHIIKQSRDAIQSTNTQLHANIFKGFLDGLEQFPHLAEYMFRMHLNLVMADLRTMVDDEKTWELLSRLRDSPLKIRLTAVIQTISLY